MKETAVLLIDCPDRKGLVARVSSLLYRHGANILHADQHQDHELGLFFMRVEWGLADGSPSAPHSFDLEAFKAEFEPLARELNMRWKLTAAGHRPRMAIFCSQYLHCVADLLFRRRAGELECEIPLIISNHRAAAELAVFYGIHFEHVSVTAGRDTAA
jgi:formyltetrahydrofolate deformylase